MDLFSRYMFRQAFTALVMISSTLTSIVWIATALKQLDLMTNKGQSFIIFAKMTSLAIPNLTALILPIALLIATVHTLNRLNGDSELIVMAASGAHQRRFAAPLLLLAALVTSFIAFVNFYVQPKSVRALQSYVVKVRTDLIGAILQPGKFSSPESGITFHLRGRAENGDLLGLVVHDRRHATQIMTYLAERARIVKNKEGVYLVMSKGHIHRFVRKSGQLQIVAFDRYIFDLSSFGKKGQKVRLGPRGRTLSELLNPDPDDPLYKQAPGSFRSELHERFASLLYPFVFVFVVVWQLGHAQTTRQGRVTSVLAAFGISAATRVAGLSASNLLASQPWAVVLVYGIPLSVILIAALLINGRITLTRLGRSRG